MQSQTVRGVVIVGIYGYSEETGLFGAPQGLLLSEREAVFAEISVDIPARELGERLFTYRVPDLLKNEIFIGTQVVVPFGNQELVGGYVVRLVESPAGEFKVKEIVEVLDNSPLFDRDYVDFLYWIAEYYCASLSSIIAASVPSDFGPRLERKVRLISPGRLDQVERGPFASERSSLQVMVDTLLEAKGGALSMRALRQRCKLGISQFYRGLTQLRQSRVIDVQSESPMKVGPKLVKTVVWTGGLPANRRQEEILNILKRGGGQLSLSQLLSLAGTTRATIRRLSESGCLEICEKEILRQPLSLKMSTSSEDRQLPDLTPAQLNVLSFAMAELKERLSDARSVAGNVEPWLLHGVTGSGKTEIYLRLIQQAIDLKRSALLLVPEISLTPQLAQRLRSRFGDKVAVWHSALSPGERYDTWQRLKAGDVSVLLGARSAVLVNMPDLGLIILDEEHDGSYKQTNPSPRYHARTVALEKARRLNAMVLLGSATPDVGTFRQARNTGRLLTLPERIHRQPMPEVNLVDMRREFQSGNKSLFSRSLSQSLTNCLSLKQQAILLINRRGYASYLFCRACGYVIKCDHCSVSLVAHQSLDMPSGYLACHHCGFRAPFLDDCPSCDGPFLSQQGLGTQRVEEELKQHFPEARSVRLDSDVAHRRGAYEEILGRFSAGESDILVGTQMVAKGLDIPNVTLVGVLSADHAFNIPDYRSIERGFQLLTQVSGRAGRGDFPGKVIMQSYNLEMPVLSWAKEHDYQHFVEQELESRCYLEYPPFSQMIRLVVSGEDASVVEAQMDELAEELSNLLEDQFAPDEIKILGPAPCLIERLRGRYRQQLLIKNLAGESGRALISSFLRMKRLRPQLRLAVDIDALDML